jgi:hypothetical protein
MDKKKYVLASLAGFAFMFLFDWILHGNILKGQYESTMHLWRSEADCIFPAMLAGQILSAFVLAFIYIKTYVNKKLIGGVKFGVMIGLLFTSGNLIMYGVAPYPAALPIGWSLGAIVQLMGVGCIFSLIYKSKNGKK